MELSGLTIVVTDECNFSCQYCYQKHGKNYLDFSTAEKALNFFFPFLSKTYHLNFYGGEPLLAFPLIQNVITLLNEKNKASNKRGVYSITTNAYLLTDEMCKFFSEHKFFIEISFDGLAQDLQRNKHNSEKVIGNILKILEYPSIQIEVNSVFSPDTVGSLSNSMQFLIALGISNIRYSFDTIRQWDQKALWKLRNEVAKLNKKVIAYYREHNSIPIANFRENQTKGLFRCNAAKDRLAITPEGEIWGCALFSDYFKGKEDSPDYHRYSLGMLDQFVKNHEKIFRKVSSNYSHLSMDNFSTSKSECLFCSYLAYCRVCPISAALFGDEIGNIPNHVCEIKKIQIEAKKTFSQSLEI